MTIKQEKSVKYSTDPVTRRRVESSVGLTDQEVLILNDLCEPLLSTGTGTTQQIQTILDILQPKSKNSKSSNESSEGSNLQQQFEELKNKYESLRAKYRAQSDYILELEQELDSSDRTGDM